MKTVAVIQLTGTTFNRLLSTDCWRPAMNGSEKNQSNPCIAHNSPYICLWSSSESRLGKRTGTGPIRGYDVVKLFAVGFRLISFCETSCVLYTNRLTCRHKLCAVYGNMQNVLLICISDRVMQKVGRQRKKHRDILHTILHLFICNFHMSFVCHFLMQV